MLEREKLNKLKKSIRQRRAISSCLYENGSYNYSEEEKNKTKNSIKSYHRKTTSSYFCGSYISSNLEDELINNINIDKIYFEKEKENKSNINKDNLDVFFDLSFNSYDSDNNNNQIKEIDNKKMKFKEEEKDNKLNNTFISFKNNLKYMKDKDEKATKSYLLALGMTNHINKKEQYIPTGSVIEEEKSDVIESKSEFSNKIYKEKENMSIKLSCALNDIINKNNKKEENKRKYLKKNKTLLLNSFFNNTYNRNKYEKHIEKIKEDKIKIKNTENNTNNIIEKLRDKMEKKFKFFVKEKIRNSYISNLFKKRYNTENNIDNKNKGSIKNKILQKNEQTKIQKISKDKILNNLNNSNLTINKNNTIIKKSSERNINQLNSGYKNKSNIPIITKIEYRGKIPHLRQKMIEKKEINNITKIKINLNSTNKNSAPNRKYLSKYDNIPHKKAHSFTKYKKDNYYSKKQIKSINDALEIIRIERVKSKKNEMNKTSLKRLNQINNSKNKHDNSSSFIKSSREKEKYKKIQIKKANSGTFRNDMSLKLIEDKSIKYPGNKNLTINAIKNYIKYEKKYIKNDVLKKIEKTSNSENSFFIIICDKLMIKNEDNKNNIIFLFKSLMKYYQKQNRFIKIYGNENIPNVISIKNININNYYIYSANKIDKTNDLLHFESINELKFTINSILICKR